MKWTCLSGLVIAASLSFGASAEQLLSAEDVRKICPRAKPAFVDTLANATDEFATAGITTRLRMTHFMAQIMTETGCLRAIEENLNYSEKRILQVFSRKRISRADAKRLARKPEPFANHVYANIIGNGGPETGDGWAYRGSGFMQLTGRANFRDRGALLSLPLEAEPDLVREAKTGLDTAIGYWVANDINRLADAHDHLAVRRAVNGRAAHGKEIARAHFNLAWTKVFRAKEDAGFESAVEVADAASEDAIYTDLLFGSGVVSESATEVRAAPEAAIREYQRNFGLPETGVIDDATKDALTDPSNWRYEWMREMDEGIVTDDTGDDSAAVVTDPREETVVVINDGGTAFTTAAISAANEGGGSTVANPNIPAQEAAFLQDARPIYPEYEMGGREVDPETFVPFSIIGTDDRAAVTPTIGFPARAIVQILFETQTGRGSLCTGAMVSEDTVLTAGHCIHSGTVWGAPFTNYRIIPGRNVGAAPFGTCGVRASYTLRGWTEAETGLDARFYDIGALKLDCDIGNETGWFALRNIQEEELDAPTIVHGYAGDKAPQGRQWKSIDKLRALQDLKGFYQNDTMGGTSGSPVYLDADNSVIVGVHTNGTHGDEPWKSNNAFTRLTDTRLQRIYEWIGAK